MAIAVATSRLNCFLKIEIVAAVSCLLTIVATNFESEKISLAAGHDTSRIQLGRTYKIFF